MDVLQAGLVADALSHLQSRQGGYGGCGVSGICQAGKNRERCQGTVLPSLSMASKKRWDHK